MRCSRTSASSSNIAFGLTTRNAKSFDGLRRRGVMEMLSLRAFRPPGSLAEPAFPGGKQQRVAVGRALLRRPRVLLLDEPMAALDRNVRHQVREELSLIHVDLGTTFLLVTHYQDEALSISSMVALITAAGSRTCQPRDPVPAPGDPLRGPVRRGGSFLAATAAGGETVA